MDLRLFPIQAFTLCNCSMMKEVGGSIMKALRLLWNCRTRSCFTRCETSSSFAQETLLHAVTRGRLPWHHAANDGPSTLAHQETNSRVCDGVPRPAHKEDDGRVGRVQLQRGKWEAMRTERPIPTWH